MPQETYKEKAEDIINLAYSKFENSDSPMLTEFLVNELADFLEKEDKTIETKHSFKWNKVFNQLISLREVLLLSSKSNDYKVKHAIRLINVLDRVFNPAIA